MLARHGKALRHFLVRREPDRDAAAMVAVVRFGDDGKADAMSRANRLLVVLHQFLLGHRQTQRRQDLVGLLLVAANSTAMCEVLLVTVAWMRCWNLPCPSCTSD